MSSQRLAYIERLACNRVMSRASPTRQHAVRQRIVWRVSLSTARQGEQITRYLSLATRKK